MTLELLITVDGHDNIRADERKRLVDQVEGLWKIVTTWKDPNNLWNEALRTVINLINKSEPTRTEHWEKEFDDEFDLWRKMPDEITDGLLIHPAELKAFIESTIAKELERALDHQVTLSIALEDLLTLNERQDNGPSARTGAAALR